MSGVGENPEGKGSITYYEIRNTNPEQRANSGRHGHLGLKGTPRVPDDAKKFARSPLSPRLYIIQPTQDLRVVLRHTYDVLRIASFVLRPTF